MISRRNLLINLGIISGAVLLNEKQVFGSNIPGPSNFTYCLNTSTISGQKVGFLKEFEVTAKAGYDGIEIWIRDLQKYLDEGGHLKDLKKYVNDLGLQVENAIGFAPWIVNDEDTRKTGTEQLKREMDLLAQVGCKRIAAPPAGATGQPIIDLFEVARRYKTILEIGDFTGVTPQLEIWGTSANLFHISQAMFVIGAADHPKACILPDVYHMFRGGSSYESLKMIAGKAIQMFHFNDYDRNIPREQQTDSDRIYPGDGGAPFKQIITDLHNAGGTKVLSLELFNAEYWQYDALEVARTGLEKMKSLVKKYLN